MPFFADEDFSFLDTYRDRSDDEDESDNERSQMSSKKDDDFSFLDTYRGDRSDDEDQSDSDHSHSNSSSSMSEVEGNDEEECVYYTGADSLSYPKVRASIHDISMFRGYTTTDKKKNKDIPAGKKGVGDSGYSGEPNKIVTTRKGQSVEMKRW
eukprot:CAMPEP_0201739072 /NCGR_PEP_ID=MMETSP0593-20130828/45583_1 /ASSEMBLY_ACC=CAM_ASM_000672 /TAXON_ID=267983 /ORGANISM="Skeletonema japonicum, Strain CCMP2506" /LENGTH=152 /DNA_ID=CAMNT_0048233313 /DNA_START=42 /DNA_END=497 /DNA_ORIENTATION=+